MSFVKSLRRLLFHQGWFFAIVLIAFLATVGSVMSLNKTGIWVMFCLFGVVVTIASVKFDYMSLLLILWSVSYTLIIIFNNVTPIMPFLLCYLIGPIVLYRLGKWFVAQLKGDEQQLLMLVLLMLICYCLQLFIVSIHDIRSEGLVTMTRSIKMEGYKAYGATGFAMIANVSLVGLGVFVTSFMTDFPNRTMRYYFLALGIMSLLCSLHLLNRSSLVISAVCILVMVLYFSGNNAWKTVFSLLIVGGLAYLIFNMVEGSDEMVKALESRNKVKGYGSDTAGGRTWRWADAIVRVFREPLGWAGRENETGYTYVHNMWLDVGRQAGLLPFISLVILTIAAMKTLYKLCHIKPKNILIGLFLGLNTCFFLEAFIEPVLENTPYLMFLYIFTWGVQAEYYNVLKRESFTQREPHEYIDQKAYLIDSKIESDINTAITSKSTGTANENA